MIREILYVLIMGLVFMSCGACSEDKDNDPGKTVPDVKETGDVKLFITTSDRAYDFAQRAVDFSKTSNMSPTTITIDPAVRYQEMDGFGAALTGSSCYNLMQMDAADRETFLKETFSHNTGMGFSYVRISIGCSDFSLSEYTCCDTPGIENFGLQSEELDYVIPVLHDVLEINPDLKILGSPWTSPRWMKVNNLTDLQPYNSWTSGHLNPDYYDEYATYFVKWIQAFAQHGIHIDAITPQNEPLNRGNSASLFMGWKEQREFVKVLGPALEEAGLDTKLYVFDHNYNYDNMSDQQDYPVKIYQDEEAGQYIKGAAYHNYGGVSDELLDIHEKAPHKELIFTETSIGTWNDGRNLSKRLMDDMEYVALETVNKWCRAVIVWNLMLDSNRGPNREGGCQTCFGAVDISADDYKTITRNSHYYIIGHLAAVVKPGAVRIGTSGYEADGVIYSAFENKDGSFAFVLMNDTDEKKMITISDRDNHFSYDVPAQSVVSYRWNQ
ncbi:glycoside hydrolase family 30 protein [Anaerophaga thermohalophila]|uniref:glycoside hydrolase family 30 protein n=1 Tax=Anaerophaga thermohalophila TaxID=177400 RepID=UPI0003074312|nr:glycoside hydrolase family 30 beta sandwich domain-containing protein [Anaerophaga thermohalophila]